MPVSRRGGTQPTLADLVAMRRALPPVPTDATRASLADRFLVPPFSVLDARQGYWQKRKKMWLELGIQAGVSDEILHNGSLGFSEQASTHYGGHAKKNRSVAPGSVMPAASLKDGKTQRGEVRERFAAHLTYGSGSPGDLAAKFKDRERRLTWVAGDKPVEDDLDEGSRKYLAASSQSTRSAFDPVLCELVYRWFCPPGGRVLDPFVGGTTAAIVATKLGRAFVGVDLNPKQVEVNRAQTDALCPGADLQWVAGDALEVGMLVDGKFDFLYSCPPYADLERYTDDPRDLSTMPYDRFLDAYCRMVSASCAMLREDRFACFVVGDVRDRRTGNYRNFVGDTACAFRAAGLELYNDAVLVTSVGSLPIRVGKQFANYRKLGKGHQNVLVFLKGDAGQATAACGPVDVDDLAMPGWEDGAVALCSQDVAGFAADGCLADGGDDADVRMVALPQREAALWADVVRGRDRVDGRPPARCWVGGAAGWVRVEDSDELTYLVGDVVYLNGMYFGGAAAPLAAAPPVRKLRGT